MSITLIIIFIFIAAMIVMMVMYRNSTLDKVEPVNGEEVFFEESGVRVEQGGSPRSTIFINCIVRVTSVRIIIAQKMLLSSKYALRHVINYSAVDSSTDLKATFKKGYVEMKVLKNSIKMDIAADGGFITIPMPESALTRGQYVKWKTKKLSDYEKINY